MADDATAPHNQHIRVGFISPFSLPPIRLNVYNRKGATMRKSQRQKFVELCPTCRNEFNKKLPLYHSWQTIHAALRNQRKKCFIEQHRGCNVEEGQY